MFSRDVPPPPPTHSLPIDIIVGAAIGGTIAIAALILALCICLRRRSRAREMPVNEDQFDASNALGQLPLLRAGLIPEPFVLTAPVRNHLASAREKGGSRHHVELLAEVDDNNDLRDPTNPPVDVVDNIVIAHARPAIGDTDALQALERSLMLERRRIDGLIQTLANRGETESNPPEYEYDIVDNVLPRDERG